MYHILPKTQKKTRIVVNPVNMPYMILITIYESSITQQSSIDDKHSRRSTFIFSPTKYMTHTLNDLFSLTTRATAIGDLYQEPRLI